MEKGYIEWVSIVSKTGIITNPFGRILYMNTDWPNGQYKKWNGIVKNITTAMKKNCRRGRSFNEEELMLELL